MTRSHFAAALAFGLLLSAHHVAAQPAGYVSATGFAEIKQFGSTGDVYYPGGGDDFSLDAIGAGGGLRIGTFLHPRLSLELAIDAAPRPELTLHEHGRLGGLIGLPG